MRVVVGADGSAAAGVALRYALGVVRDAGGSVTVVHAVPSHLPLPAGLDEAVRAAGSDLLDDVLWRARLEAPQVDVRAQLREGPPGQQLAQAARDADLVVLGRRADPEGGARTGALAAAVVAQTDRAVRVVPPDWFQRAPRSEVVVGIGDPATARAQVERGFQAARDLGQPLVLLHAWGLPSGYETVMALADTDAWYHQLVAQVEAAARPFRTRYPDVSYHVRVVRGRPARVLEAAARRAVLLVLGRGSHQPERPGVDIARCLMTVSRCLVEVVAQPRPPSPVLVLELGRSARCDQPADRP